MIFFIFFYIIHVNSSIHIGFFPDLRWQARQWVYVRRPMEGPRRARRGRPPHLDFNTFNFSSEILHKVTTNRGNAGALCFWALLSIPFVASCRISFIHSITLLPTSTLPSNPSTSGSARKIKILSRASLAWHYQVVLKNQPRV